MRVFAAMLVALVVAGCGGGRSDRYDAGGGVTRLSSGPISKACLSSDRKARNSRLCGCIQTVANQSLSGSDQRKAVGFFKDPQRAQDMKMSQTAADDAFWERYEAFASRAQQYCTGY